MNSSTSGVSGPVDVSEQTFEQDVIERSREKPVVVDFWADWCGPCHALAPVLEREVESRGGDVVLAKIDVDANPGIAATYRVQGIPAVKAFRDGRVVSEFVGARGAAAVATFLDELLAPPRLTSLVEELRAEGALPDVVEALDRGDEQVALELVLAAIPGAVPEQRDRLRELAVAVFEHLGHEDPVAVAYRRKLATALY
jgi:putative thioredoxin